MEKILVLDKSYLTGTPTERIKQVCSEYRLIMPTELFMELMRHASLEKRIQRAQCFRKIPKGNTPIDLINTIDNLIAYELKFKQPCCPISKHIVQKSWYFNDRLCDPEWSPDSPSASDIRDWNNELDDNVSKYQQMNSTIDRIFPVLNQYHPGQPSDPINELMDQIASDAAFITSFVEARYQLELSFKVSKSWALYRYSQVQLIYALDYIRKYGPNNPYVISTHIPHDYLDMQYCMLGVLVGGLATRDEVMAEYFRLLCSDGLLLQK